MSKRSIILIAEDSRQEADIINSATDTKYRKSRIRTSILDYLKSSTSHPSAQDVHLAIQNRHPRISFGTVYRNLNILVDTGAAQRLESSRGKDRFDAQLPQHAHFQCESCGNLFDLPKIPESLIKELSDTTGHKITGHNTEFFGICSSCR
ncbi:MAG: transcriptional repressor [Spirochaetaceae bacterium]|nr:transcriptional repressor [Spirochaetaceae bacterium]